MKLSVSLIFVLIFSGDGFVFGQLNIWNTKETKNSSTDTSVNTIRGRVIDSQTRDFLAGASVVIKGTRIGTTTGLEGRFYLIIPGNFRSDKIVLIISTLGYVQKMFAINQNHLQTKKDFPLTKRNELQGRVIDAQTKDLLAEAVVVIKGTNIITSTDAEGNFYLAIPEKLEEPQIVLAISLVGYKRKEFRVVRRKNIQGKKDFLITPTESY